MEITTGFHSCVYLIHLGKIVRMDIGKESFYNIQNLCLFFIITVLLMLTSCSTYSQRSFTNKYGLVIINTKQDYKKMIAADSSMGMVDLKEIIPGLLLDLKYGSTDNFMQTLLYPGIIKTTYLRMPAAMGLQRVQQELATYGLGLKVWDAYRPYAVTEKMWEQVKDDRYAADPKFGSGHNRGIAVDLTLVDLKTGIEKNMGTGFDNFTDTAHSNFTLLPADVLNNRQLLINMMQKNGFKVLDTEWWHFYLPESKKFPLMDLGFDEMEKLTVKRKIKNK